MARNLMVWLAAAALVSGCSGKRGDSMAPQRPPVASEMALFADMVGTWEGSWEICGRMAEQMRAEHPDAPLTFKSQTTWTPYMDGQWYKAEGWYELTPDLRATYVEYIGYNSKDKEFQSYFISDMGEVGHGSWRPCDGDNRCFKMKWTGHDMNGVKKSGSGCMNFVDKDHIEYSWTEDMGLFSKMEMTGTATRKQ